MNQDFLIPSTPAIARKLTELACIAPANLDQSIRDLAKTGLISDEQFDALPIKIDDKMKKVIQQLVDENFRSMLAISKLNEEDALNAILCAAHIANIKPITFVFYKNKSILYRNAFKAFKLTFGADANTNPDVLLLSYDKNLNTDCMFSSERRGGLLLAFMVPHSTQLLNFLSVEFEKMVFVYATDTRNPKEEWYVSVEFEPLMMLLFPHSTFTPIRNNPHYRKTYLMQRGFHKTHPREMRFMFNINDDYDIRKVEDTNNDIDDEEREIENRIRARIKADFDSMF